MNIISRLFRRGGENRIWALERRLNRRALLYWESIRGKDALVSIDAFDRRALEDYSSHGFMLDLRDAAAPVLCHVGPVLHEEADLHTVPVALSNVPERSLLGQFAGRWASVTARQQPVTTEYDFQTESYRILCRGVLLPLSSDGQEIDHVYGVISWKSEKLRSVQG